MKKIVLLVVLALALSGVAVEREYLWTESVMPDARSNQVARTTAEPDLGNRIAYIDWYDPPADPNGGVIIMISGGGYYSCCDTDLFNNRWPRCFGEAGFQLVNLCYRTPRPEGLPIYQTAWEDGQRAVRLVRSQAARRGFDPERIGVVAMSAGSHLATLLATSSQTPAYAPTDALDEVPCHVNFAITGAIAYGLTTAAGGVPDRDGGRDGVPTPEFKFDAKTCPMCMLHGGTDEYSPLCSTQVYRQLRRMGVPAELHLYADAGHGGFWNFDWEESVLGFIRQLNLDRKLGGEIALYQRFASDADRDETLYRREDVWPEGMMPDVRTNQCTPYIEWHFPKERKTRAIQIVYSGGAYLGNEPASFEVAPFRRFLNEQGMTVVTLKYRTPRPERLRKHVTAWQDLQRAIRMVRSEAPAYGLDPHRIGIMGSSAGGHLTLLGVLSSTVPAYAPIDELDAIPCNVNWAIAIYPAYILTDGMEDYNTTGGNDDRALFAPEFAFDGKECPMVFVHGDADEWAAMGSVRTWEALREKGVQCDLHTLATRRHCFHSNAAPGTGSYTWMNRLWSFLTRKGFNR